MVSTVVNLPLKPPQKTKTHNTNTKHTHLYIFTQTHDFCQPDHLFWKTNIKMKAPDKHKYIFRYTFFDRNSERFLTFDKLKQRDLQFPME